jgi:hypothetical protein
MLAKRRARGGGCADCALSGANLCESPAASKGGAVRRGSRRGASSSSSALSAPPARTTRAAAARAAACAHNARCALLRLDEGVLGRVLAELQARDLLT